MKIEFFSKIILLLIYCIYYYYFFNLSLKTLTWFQMFNLRLDIKRAKQSQFYNGYNGTCIIGLIY